MGKNKKYKEMMAQFVEYQQDLHEKNQKRIRVGLKINILVPLIFLIISFATQGSKLIFLILWIVSLFGIAFYLVYVEYTDYVMMEKMKQFGMINEEEETPVLIGDGIEHAHEELKRMEEDIREEKEKIREEFLEDIREEKEKIATKIKKKKDKEEIK